MNTSDQVTALGIAKRGHGPALVLLAFAQLIYSLDINIVFVALPDIGTGLHFSGQTLQWVVSAYMVLCGGFLLFGGRAADLIGQRRSSSHSRSTRSRRSAADWRALLR